MFAQLSTSVSDGQIRLIILALLAVAVLLAALTVWYAVKTSPRRRVRELEARRRSTASEATSRPAPNAGASSTAAAGARSAARPASSPARPVAADLVDDDDEWTRLTAPQPRRSPGG